MPVRLTLREGDYVVYAAEPTLYGLMTVREVRKVRKDKVRRVVCRVDESRRGVRTYEIFDVDELELPATVPAKA